MGVRVSVLRVGGHTVADGGDEEDTAVRGERWGKGTVEAVVAHGGGEDGTPGRGEEGGVGGGGGDGRGGRRDK